jgi:hypothetical protein
MAKIYLIALTLLLTCTQPHLSAFCRKESTKFEQLHMLDNNVVDLIGESGSYTYDVLGVGAFSIF